MVVGNDYWDKYIDYIITSFISSNMVMYGTGSEENHGYCEIGEMWAYYMQSTLYNCGPEGAEEKDAEHVSSA